MRLKSVFSFATACRQVGQRRRFLRAQPLERRCEISADPLAEKLPTMPPVATLPVMRDTVSSSPLSAASMVSAWMA